MKPPHQPPVVLLGYFSVENNVRLHLYLAQTMSNQQPNLKCATTSLQAHSATHTVQRKTLSKPPRVPTPGQRMPRPTEDSDDLTLQQRFLVRFRDRFGGTRPSRSFPCRPARCQCCIRGAAPNLAIVAAYTMRQLLRAPALRGPMTTVCRLGLLKALQMLPIPATAMQA